MSRFRSVRPPAAGRIIQRKTSAEYGGDCAADRSLLPSSSSAAGTWAHIADKSSRSRLCWLQLFPVLLTASLHHYSAQELRKAKEKS